MTQNTNMCLISAKRSFILTETNKVFVTNNLAEIYELCVVLSHATSSYIDHLLGITNNNNTSIHLTVQLYDVDDSMKIMIRTDNDDKRIINNSRARLQNMRQNMINDH